MEVQFGSLRLALERLDRKLRDPRHALFGVRRDFDAKEQRLRRAFELRVSEKRERLRQLDRRLHRVDPSARLAQQRRHLEQLAERMRRALPPRLEADHAALQRIEDRLRVSKAAMLDHHRQRLGMLGASLDALSPLRVLARGYAIALAEGRALVDATSVKPGDTIRLRLAHGSLEAEVKHINPEESP